MIDRNTMYRVDAEPDIAAWLIETQVLVEVVPCMHGNYARHLLTVLENFERVYCDRVGKGDNDEWVPVRAGTELYDIPNPATGVLRRVWPKTCLHGLTLGDGTSEICAECGVTVRVGKGDNE